MTAKELIASLNLSAHVEGGAFRETYRSAQVLYPEGYPGVRSAATAIYFLLQEGEFSAFHRILSDEMWHHYTGDPLHIYEIDRNGKLIIHKLGKNLDDGEKFQLVIPGGSWFASRCEKPGGHTLAGCTVAPGFDFKDFELADRAQLIQLFPEHAELINSMTYPQ
ncbi:MAG: hypothetical protein GC180_02545 [Bacteroidetes bacterium]|nr:hypothetical protein [Bacteroidota bacterium]